MAIPVDKSILGNSSGTRRRPQERNVGFGLKLTSREPMVMAYNSALPGRDLNGSIAGSEVAIPSTACCTLSWRDTGLWVETQT